MLCASLCVQHISYLGLSCIFQDNLDTYRWINVGIKIYGHFIFQFVWTTFTTAVTYHIQHIYYLSVTT